MMTPQQCQSARGALDWSHEALAQAAKVDPGAVAAFEAGSGQLSDSEKEAISRALAAASRTDAATSGADGVLALDPSQLNSSNDK